VDTGASANLELVNKFCYSGDMLSVDGNADAAMEARIRTGWNKFRQTVLTRPCNVLRHVTARYKLSFYYYYYYCLPIRMYH